MNFENYTNFCCERIVPYFAP